MERSDREAVSRDAALAALDIGTLPLVLAGPRAVIIHANRAAEVLLAAKRTFHKTGGRLVVRRQVDQDAIEAALAATLADGERAVVQLTNRQGDIHHVLAIAPLPSDAFAAITIAELRAPLLLHRAWSQEALSLPRPYAELAEAMVVGENLAEFSERTGLSIGGARTRLKKLLRRLGARSQSDLVSLLLRAAAILPMR